MLSHLPEHLRERCLVSTADTNDGDYVLYWMRTAVRVDENPALDVARLLACKQGVPLLVYHAISEHYDYASDRHHTFMLEGARDVQQQFRDLDLDYAFHLATPQDRRPHLVTLAQQANCVVTELMPVDPPRRFVEALSNRVSTPIISVDTACVVPMTLVKKPFVRAFKYRSATKKQYAERLTRAWPTLDVVTERFPLEKLPFEPLEITSSSIPELVAQCEIDHAVAAVVDSRGGSQAGYERWNRFKEKGLRGYAKKRNNALVDGVSRMSPYLHYGMVSPMRIARESAAIDNAGSEKYLDELLIWREMAYAFCFHRDDHDQWSAIPEWAQQTLENHAGDLRHEIYNWEQLARGETQDAFWNVAQKSLLRHGELHNNVRMTWGKALLDWLETPQQALQTIIDLNHRYALDGRDPASYGGILWCLGQFDRPFEPPQNILGTVRPRPTSQHASRLDTTKFLAKVNAPRHQPISRVAVIGAGISGLMAARTLQDHGLPVTVFEKSRGLGGRMATRRTDTAHASFDHGSQYFRARDKRFQRYVDAWLQEGLIARWPDASLGDDQQIVKMEAGKIEPLIDAEASYVGVPAMNSLCKHLAREIEIHKQKRVGEILQDGPGWDLLDDEGASLGQFDRVIVAIPAEQAALLLHREAELVKQIHDVGFQPCWSVMAGFEQPLTDQWVGAFPQASSLAWIARNSTKPGRNGAFEHLVLHANADWSSEKEGSKPDAVAEELLLEFWRVSGIAPSAASDLNAHWWKYSTPTQRQTDGCYLNSTKTIAVCGDWAFNGRVEGAFLSGSAAAGRILGTLSPLSATKPIGQRSLFTS